MIQHRRLDAGREFAQHAVARLGDDGEMVLEIFPGARLVEQIGRRQRLHQRFGRAAGFGDRNEARGLQIDLRKIFPPRERVGIVVEGDTRRAAVMAFERGLERLAAKARSADAEDCDVGRVLAERLGHGLGGRDIVGALRHAQKRQRLVRLRVLEPRQMRHDRLQRRVIALARHSALSGCCEFEGDFKRKRGHRKPVSSSWRQSTSSTALRPVKDRRPCSQA